jgi:hypothetical protein
MSPSIVALLMVAGVTVAMLIGVFLAGHLTARRRKHPPEREE